MDWIKVCKIEEIEIEDVIRFDHSEHTFAVYRSPDGNVYATDGLCTHKKVHLANGFVMDNLIECPKHNGRFDYRTGEPKKAPVCEGLRTYPTRVVDGIIYIQIG